MIKALPTDTKDEAIVDALVASRMAGRVLGRPSFETIYMRLALHLAERSTCKRLQTGVVITSADYRQVLAVGYNGNAAGLPNTCDSDEPGKCGCLHAEDNVVINCVAPRSQSKIVFVSHNPCVICAKRLINLGGVTHVFWHGRYRDMSSIDLLLDHGIDCPQQRNA